VVRPLVRALSRFTARIRHFFLTIDHFLRTTAALIHAISNATRPDILYCNDLDTLIAGVWLRDHFDCPLVYDAHEFWAYMTPDALWFETAFWLAVERQFAARADAAFTVSPQLAAAMREATGVPFRSAPNCEPHRARAPKSDLAQLGLLIEAAAKGRVRFLFQGNFEHHRGIEEILRGWTLVDSKRAVLFLRGPKNSYRDDFIQLAAELKVLEGSVFFLDAVCETDLIAAARFADVGIISYKPACLNNRLACPNKTSQYMQAGLAILTNKLDYVKQIVADFQCGLAYDSDLPESFAAAVNRFVDDGGFLRACQQKGQTASADVFNWEVQSRDLFETCDRLAGVEKPRAAGIAA
jgi:glycosyltransferase involved in cell wall biosynthesis